MDLILVWLNKVLGTFQGSETKKQKVEKHAKYNFFFLNQNSTTIATKGEREITTKRIEGKRQSTTYENIFPFFLITVVMTA